MCDACVLKDYATITTGKDGTYINTSEIVVWRQPVSGDVLTGIIAGIACLYKYEEHHQNGLLQWLFYIHGCAGDVCKGRKRALTALWHGI